MANSKTHTEAINEATGYTRVTDEEYSKHLLAANPKYAFCECEADCAHRGCCGETENLADYRVASFRQTLCPACANHAFDYCQPVRADFEILAGAR